jgi:hypothetical protein
MEFFDLSAEAGQNQCSRPALQVWRGILRFHFEECP